MAYKITDACISVSLCSRMSVSCISEGDTRYEIDASSSTVAVCKCLSVGAPVQNNWA